MANNLSLAQNLIILCGHFKGIDYRIREHLITKEISIGDYVLTGGELAAAVMADAIVRIIPGVISDEQSALSDSFQDNLLAAPVSVSYTHLIPDSVGISMTFKYDNVNLMDFQRIDELHDIGYNRTISMMDSLKSRIHRRVNADNIRLRRMVYKSCLLYTS